MWEAYKSQPYCIFFKRVTLMIWTKLRLGSVFIFFFFRIRASFFFSIILAFVVPLHSFPLPTFLFSCILFILSHIHPHFSTSFNWIWFLLTYLLRFSRSCDVELLNTDSQRSYFFTFSWFMSNLFLLLFIILQSHFLQKRVFLLLFLLKTKQ